MRFDGREGVEHLPARVCTRFSGFWTTMSGFTCCWRTYTGPEVRGSQDAGDGLDASVACARVFLADGCAVNGIHSSRFNCYRTPAGCLVTVLPPWVHAAR